MVREWHSLDLCLSSNGDNVSNGHIEFEFVQPPRSTAGDVAFYTEDKQPVPAQVPIESMAPETTQTFRFFTYATVATTRKFKVKVTYETEQGFSLLCVQQMELSYQQSLGTQIRFLSTSSCQLISPVESSAGSAPVVPLIPGQPVLVFADIENMCDHPLCIANVEARLTPNANKCTLKPVSATSSSEEPFCKGDCFTVCFELTPGESEDGERIGDLIVHFSRHSAVDVQCEGEFPLNAVVQRSLPLSLTASPTVPLVCGETAQISYTLSNHSKHVQECRVSMTLNDSFIVAGVTGLLVQILPDSEHKFSYNVVPVKTGYVEVPQINIQPTSLDSNNADAVSLQQLIQLSMPNRKSCYVRPRQMK